MRNLFKKKNLRFSLFSYVSIHQCKKFYHYAQTFITVNICHLPRESIVTKWPHFIHRGRMFVKMILKRDMFSQRFESTICYTMRGLEEKNYLYTARFTNTLCQFKSGTIYHRIRDLHYTLRRARSSTLCTNHIIQRSRKTHSFESITGGKIN